MLLNKKLPLAPNLTLRTAPLIPIGLIALCMLLRASDLIFRNEMVGQLSTLHLITLEHLLGALLFFPLIGRLRVVTTMNRQELFALLFIAAGASVGGIFFFSQAFIYINPVIVILLQKLQPLVTICLATILLGERPSRHFYLWGLLALIASFFVTFGFDFSMTVNSSIWQGIGCALLACLFWGAGTVFGKQLLHRYPPLTITQLRYWGGLITSLTLYTLTQATPLGLLQPLQTTPLPLIYMAVITGLLPLFLFYRGLGGLSSSLTSLLELLYPLFSILIGGIVLQRPLSPTQIGATAILILAITKLQRRV